LKLPISGGKNEDLNMGKSKSIPLDLPLKVRRKKKFDGLR